MRCRARIHAIVEGHSAAPTCVTDRSTARVASSLVAAVSMRRRVLLQRRGGQEGCEETWWLGQRVWVERTDVAAHPPRRACPRLAGL